MLGQQAEAKAWEKKPQEQTGTKHYRRSQKRLTRLLIVNVNRSKLFYPTLLNLFQCLTPIFFVGIPNIITKRNAL